MSGPELVGMSGDSLREAFGKALVTLAPEFPFVVLDADIAGGTGVHHFRKSYPDRFIQCGIAEQNMMAMAGGLAAVGIPVFVTTFAVFCLRAVEQARLSLAYSGRNVKIVASHPGLDVGPDGASAQCLEDLAMFRAIPGMTVISPADPIEMAHATRAVLAYDGPVYMRSGRSNARRIPQLDQPFTIGQARILKTGDHVTLVACGKMVAECLDAAEMLAAQGISAEVIAMSTIKPLDRKTLATSVRKTGCLVTAEDHNIFGGLGSAVAEAIVQDHPCPMEMVGVKDCFGASGEPDELASAFGLTAKEICVAAETAIGRKSNGAQG